MITIKLRTARSWQIQFPPDPNDVYWNNNELRLARAVVLAEATGKLFFVHCDAPLARLRWTHNGEFTGYCWFPATGQFRRREGDPDDSAQAENIAIAARIAASRR